jgi:threonine/homoserine/homoserine lactone efflux protein
MLNDLIALLIIVVSVIGTPGPNNILLFKSGIDKGYRKTIPLLLSINIGVIGVVFLSYIGTSYLRIWLPVLEDYFGFAAFIFLCYMAFSMWPTNKSINVCCESKNESLYLYIFLFQFINPKIWIISLVIITNFYNSLNLFIMCISIFIIGFTLNSLWVMSGQFLNNVSDISEKNISKAGSVSMVLIALYFIYN